MKVVLVHGIFNTGHILFWMKWMLKRKGFECYSPSLWPLDGRKGIEYAAQDLKRKIDKKYGPTEQIAVIGFSMGGIVARYYLQQLDGAKRTKAFFSIATPHNGSYWAYLPYPTKGVSQLRPNSDFLKELSKNDEKLARIQLYSYWTPLDTSIVPSWSSHWLAATNMKFFSILHLTIIFNRRVINEIAVNLHRIELPVSGMHKR